MTKFSLIDLNVAKLFEERSVEDIVEIEKLLDAEIERKRSELRSMVGDRYKDILAATEAIKSMEHLSVSIVDDIQNVKDRCELIVQNTFSDVPKKHLTIDPEKVEERTILVKIRLAFELNEHIWVALDDEDHCRAAQFYLLCQHVHTGLRLLNKEVFENYKVINKLKSTLDSLRDRILKYTIKKLESVDISIEDTCNNLNALMLLENHKGSDLLHKFIELRKNALNTVIETSYPSVRAQISAMVKCLYTTVHLLHDCFLNHSDTKKGLMWIELEQIVSDRSLPTITKIELPVSNLIRYIPDVIKQFRPKCSNVEYTLSKKECVTIIQKWMQETGEKIEEGLKKALELVPNVKGLHIIREEAFKIDFPENWDEICSYTELPKNFDIWFYYFHKFVTNRAQYLITNKITTIFSKLQENLEKALNNLSKSDSESDLRSYVLHENTSDFQHSSDYRFTLSMKTKGFSPKVVKLCEDLDTKYLELLEDICLYMYGKDYKKEDESVTIQQDKTKINKIVDREKLENHLKTETATHISKLIEFLRNFIDNNKNDTYIIKSILCARFLYGLTTLCTNLNKCCCCDESSLEWDKICDKLNKSGLIFWEHWFNDCNKQLTEISSEHLSNITTLKMLGMFSKWDTIEIQEQTDEKTVKSQIKVPMKMSIALHQILDSMCEMLNAVLPHTLPKQVHLQFIEKNTLTILKQYEVLLEKELNQTQALQFLFDVKFLTTFCIPRENMDLVQKSQDICDKLRCIVDPFDLDVFYKYLQYNVKQSVLQSQVILGSLLPSSGQLANLGILEKNKEHEKEPSILALSTPETNNWFLLLPVTAPVQKTVQPVLAQSGENKSTKSKQSGKKSEGPQAGVRSGAAALFGAMTTDWGLSRTSPDVLCAPVKGIGEKQIVEFGVRLPTYFLCAITLLVIEAMAMCTLNN